MFMWPGELGKILENKIIFIIKQTQINKKCKSCKKHTQPSTTTSRAELNVIFKACIFFGKLVKPVWQVSTSQQCLQTS